MNTLIRWGKFSLVGAMGMVVQLIALTLSCPWMPHHYLYASTAALEITLIHNFVWHLKFTWRDRQTSPAPVRQFLRFHLSNGLISLLGNLALMHLFVQEAHLPILLSNLGSILSCSVANFFLGNNWAFTLNRKSTLTQQAP
jgi:putative flippase GtrA